MYSALLTLVKAGRGRPTQTMKSLRFAEVWHRTDCQAATA